MNDEFWLVTTEHLEDRLWFRDGEDFKAGMNFVPIIAFEEKVDVVAFILMSNHVHFILHCPSNKAKVFVDSFKKAYSQYFRCRYGIPGLLRRNDVDIRPLAVGDESLERAIAYVHMNCVAANICLNPFEYRWGTGGCFFRSSEELEGDCPSKMSRRKLIALTHSYKEIPAHLLFDKTGCIIPSSYIEVSFVEKLFKTPKRMMYFLNSSSKSRISKNADKMPSFKDQTIMYAVPDLCQSLFHKNSVKTLTSEELCTLSRQIRYRFSSDPHQISRILGLTYDTISKLLD